MSQQLSNVCKLWVSHGTCRYGAACKFLHPQLPFGQTQQGSRKRVFDPYANASGAQEAQQQPQIAHLGRTQPRQAAEPLPPAYTTRAWQACDDSAEAGSSDGLKLRVMSYNLLADELAHEHRRELYSSASSLHLSWPRRWSLIRDEIEHFLPDVLCLQEVDHWDEVKEALQALGYEGQYLQRSGGRPDGCATLWQADVLELVAINRLNFADFDLRDNVGLMTVIKHRQAHRQASLQHTQRRPASRHHSRRHHRSRRHGSSSESSTSSESSDESDGGAGQWDKTIPAPRVAVRAAEAEAARRRGGSSSRRREKGSSSLAAAAAAATSDHQSSPPFIAVANTHILFNPKRGDIKLAQLRLLIQHLQALIAAAVPEQHADHVVALLMGDFNSVPDTPLYEFMRHGWIDCLKHHRKDMAGNKVLTKPKPQVNIMFPGRQQPWQAMGQHMQGNWQQQQHMQMGLGMQQPNYMLPHQQQMMMLQYGMHGQLHVQQQQQMLMQMQYGQAQHQHQQQVHQHFQQQQQQQQQQPMQQQRPLPRSASAPMLTLRRLKKAGWTAEELITATGGAHSTHLRHFLQQHHQQEQGNEEQEEADHHLQQQQQQQSFALQELRQSGLAAAVSAANAAATALEARLGRTAGTTAGDVPPPPPPPPPPLGQQQQSRHQQQQQQQYRPSRDLQLADDSGEEMDLSDGEQKQQRRPGGSSSRAAAAVGTARGAFHGGAASAPEAGDWNDSGEDMDLADDNSSSRHWQLQQQRQHLQQQLNALTDAQIQEQTGAGAGKRPSSKRQRAGHQQQQQQQGPILQPRPWQPQQQQQEQQQHAPPPPLLQPRPRQQQQQQLADLNPVVAPTHHAQPQQQGSMPAAAAVSQQGQAAAGAGSSRRSHGSNPRGSARSGSPDGQKQPEVPFFLRPHTPSNLLDKPLPAAVGDGIARHNLTLRSCYAQVLGSEPQYTSCHDSFWGTVDFIWYTPQEGCHVLRPVAVLLPPSPDTHLSRVRCMPNGTIPSDHISLVADFKLSVATSQEPV